MDVNWGYSWYEYIPREIVFLRQNATRVIMNDMIEAMISCMLRSWDVM
jgi:hypothetical protein